MNRIFQGVRSKNLFLPPGYHVNRCEIKTVALENILDHLWGHSSPSKIKDTPHYKYAQGNPALLEEYFASCRGVTWARPGTAAENMTVKELCVMFDDILNSDMEYLEPPHESHYIIVRSNWLCIDGLRRSCALLSEGVNYAPVAWVY